MSIYKGESDGLRQVVDGFVDYAIETNVGRAIPNIYDGLKPVHKLSVFVMNKEKVYKPTKSAKVLGMIMSAHNHGDASIYDAVTRLSESNGSYIIPLIKGTGNMSYAYSGEAPASMRYTELELSRYVDLFLKDLRGVEFVDIETDFNGGVAPKYLPARVPTALLTGAEGIAVGTRSQLPSFAFDEVIELTKKYLKTGNIVGELIYPNYPVGGIVVADDKEIYKVMAKGQGKLKFRAKLEVKGKVITVKEVPVGRTDDSIVRAVHKLIRANRDKSSGVNFPYFTNDSKVYKTSDFNGCGVTLEVKNKAMVEDCILRLYREGILQTTVTANMLYTDGESLIHSSVYDVIERWVEERKKVLTNRMSLDLADYEKEYNILDYFIKLVNMPEEKVTYLELLSKQGVSVASDYLVSLFPEIPENVTDWISKRRASAFHVGGKQLQRFEELGSSIEELKLALSDLTTFIYNELTEIQKEYSGLFPRATEVSYTDYKFTKVEEKEEVDTTPCFYALYNDGTFVKSRSAEELILEGLVSVYRGNASSVSVGFTDTGSAIRVYGNTIPWGGVNLQELYGAGTPMFMSGAESGKFLLIYEDGKTGVFDTDALVAKRSSKKIITNGVAPDVGSTILSVVPLTGNEDKYLALYHQDGPRSKVGYVKISDIPVKRSTAKSRAIVVGDSPNITQYALIDESDIYKAFNPLVHKPGKMTKLTVEIIEAIGDKFKEVTYVPAD